MSDTFDPRVIAANSERKKLREQNIALGASYANRLIEGEWHDELMAMFDKLAGIPIEPKRPRPTIEIGACTLYVYGKKGASNLKLKKAMAACVRLEFPDGAVITKVRNSRLTMRLDDGSGRQVVVYRSRKSSREPWHWSIMNPSGFKPTSGRRAGQRLRGPGPDKSPS